MKSFSELTHPDLIHGNIVKSILIFTMPLIVSYIFQQLYNAADTVIIGHFLNETSLIAIGACTALYELLVGFGMGFGNGLSIVAARAFGAGDYESLKKITASSFIITIGVTFFIMGISFLFLKPVMILLNTPQQVLEEAYSYISVITAFCGFLFAYNLFAGMLRAIGNSFTPLLFLIFSSILNVILDVLCIKYLNLGIKGAAVATIIAQGVSAVLCLLYIYKFSPVLVPSLSHFKFNARLYRDLVAQGLSMALMGSVVHTGTVILQRGINSLDPLVIAGHLCARKIFTLTNIPIITLGLSASTFVSQNLGAGQSERIKKGVKYSIFMTFIWALVLIGPAFLGIRPLVRFMSGSDNLTIVNYASRYILFTIPFYPVLGVLIITRNSLQGMGQKILPLFSSLIEFVGKIIFASVIIPRFGQWGVIFCEPLIWCVMMVHLIWSFLKALKEV